MVALRLRSYLGQPGSPLVANATQAACMVLASSCGGSPPRSGPKSGASLLRVSKTKGISRAWTAPKPGEDHANLEQPFGAGHGEQRADAHRTSRLAEDGDVAGVAAEGGDVLLHPVQCGDLVEQAEI